MDIIRLIDSFHKQFAESSEMDKMSESLLLRKEYYLKIEGSVHVYDQPTMVD